MKKTLFGFVLVTALFMAGCSSEDAESDTVESSQQTTETTTAPSEDDEEIDDSDETDDSDADISESSEEETDSEANQVSADDLEVQLEKLSDTYAEMIAEVEGYIANPDTYHLTAYTSIMRNYTDLMRELQTTTEAIEAADLGDGWAYHDIYMDILEDSVKLTEAFGNLPEMQP